MLSSQNEKQLKKIAEMLKLYEEQMKKLLELQENLYNLAMKISKAESIEKAQEKIASLNE